jgi:pimeloyl-ACP methyl ester carboxylesterase
VLGQYFAAMYPSKVGRLVIDGVLDANDYRAGEWYLSLEDTDAVLLSFFEFCHQAGPSKCPLYGSTVPNIRKRVDTIIGSLSQAPVPIPLSSKGPVVITKKVLHRLMFVALYQPTAVFPILADILIAIETDNISALTDIIDQFINLNIECSCASPLPWQQYVSTSATLAIACGDADKHPNGSDDYKSYFDKLMAKSAFAAPILGMIPLACSEWMMTPKWRYTGPFAANTSYPLLIASPKFDPVCPLTNAKAAQKQYAGSALLVQNSYGHCTTSSPSLCTAKHIRAYFGEGTLPAAETTCEVEELPFIGKVENDVKLLSREDAELLEALRALARVVPRFGLVR